MSLTPDELDDCNQWEGDAELVDFDSITHQTDKAALFVIDGEEKWVPKSLIAGVEEDAVWVATWWAEQEGLV